MTTFEIPDSVTTLDTYVFKGCSNLENITIGFGLISITNNVLDDLPFVKDKVFAVMCYFSHVFSPFLAEHSRRREIYTKKPYVTIWNYVQD